MALVSSSQPVLDQSATPITKTNALEKGGVLRSYIGNIVAGSFTGGTAGQWYTFVRVPVRGRVKEVNLIGATTTSGAVKCGLYRPDGIAIDDDVFATNFDMAAEKDGTSILVTPTSVQRTQSIAEAYATAISAAGATGDVEVDIALTIVTALGAGIAHAMEVVMVLPE
jgi:hypothetical protein